jgi:hypothetical protein
MASQSFSMSELLDLAVDKLPALRRRVAKVRLSTSRRYRNSVLDQLCLHCCDNPECSAILGASATGLMSGEILSTDKFSLDLDQLERFLQIIIEYLPKLLEIILPLFMQIVMLALAIVFAGSSANAQQCSIDPITGQRTCQPIKKVLVASASVVGNTLSSVGKAITPNPLATATTDCICGPNCQCDAGGTPCQCPRPPVQSPVQSAAIIPVATFYSSPPVTFGSPAGWSKSWHKVHGQPVRNVGRRLFGR